MSTIFDWYPYPFEEDRSFPGRVGYHHLLILGERMEYHIKKGKVKYPEGAFHRRRSWLHMWIDGS